CRQWRSAACGCMPPARSGAYSCSCTPFAIWRASYDRVRSRKSPPPQCERTPRNRRGGRSMTVILLVTFGLLLLLGVPVAFCMILSSLAALLYLGIDPIMVGLETTRSLSSFYAFLAVPFFILAGEIMSRGGCRSDLSPS